MLTAALHAEVATYTEVFRDEVDENGHRLVVRNGFREPQRVATAAGAAPVRGAGLVAWITYAQCSSAVPPVGGQLLEALGASGPSVPRPRRRYGLGADDCYRSDSAAMSGPGSGS